MRLAKYMRRDWDERARKDAFYYIASSRQDWDPTSFLASGENDFERLVAPVLRRFSIQPEEQTALELGCGAGRMTASFSRRFRHVVAVDISAEMVDRGRKLLDHAANITWVHGNGVDLKESADSSVDFVFSFIVLQHLPSKAFVLSYIREMLRVVRPGGFCLFQWNAAERPTMNWRGRFAWGLIDFLWALGFARLGRFAARLMKFDPRMIGKTWRGVVIPAEIIGETVRKAGATVLEFRDEHSSMAWCLASRNP